MPIFYSHQPVLSFFDALAEQLAAQSAVHHKQQQAQAVRPQSQVLQQIKKQPQPQQTVKSSVIVPPINIYDLSTSYVIQASLPGANLAEIEVGYNPDPSQITLSGVISERLNGQVIGTDIQQLERVIERKSGKFERNINLPSSVRIDSDKISAKYINGVLEIVVPKAAKPVKRSIVVQVEERQPGSIIIERKPEAVEKVAEKASTESPVKSNDIPTKAVEEEMENVESAKTSEQPQISPDESETPGVIKRRSVELEDEEETDDASIISVDSSF
ncbi:hypothetical protein V1512DRAFT_267745 [Lipomyces arxii]|uniref:uncharacterized protein n=1 Tax=Lipomyces arxii TaxID=56418 RepID=UPI0034CD8E53